MRVDRGLGVLSQNALLPPLPERSRGPGVRIVVRAVFGFTLAEDDPHKVIGARGGIPVLHCRRDLVIKLRGPTGQTYRFKVITNGAEGLYLGRQGLTNGV